MSKFRQALVLSLTTLGCGGGSAAANDMPAFTAGTGGTSGTSSGGKSGGNPGGSSAGGTSAGGTSAGGTSASGTGGKADNTAGGTVMTGTGPLKCGAGLDAGEFQADTWKNISPSDLKLGMDAAKVTESAGFAVAKSDPKVIYLTASSTDLTNFNPLGGQICKTVDGGATWAPVGKFDSAFIVRIDPTNPDRIYVGDGVRGGTMGFWVSVDGGQTFVMPKGFIEQVVNVVKTSDIYQIEVDPTDFDHILVTFHYAWQNCEDFGFGTCTSGVVESFDGGGSWTVHDPDPGWANAGGYSVFFLYEPDLNVGDAKTWLYGSQGKGYFRTADGGKTWKQVSNVSMIHGGAKIYYAKSNKALYLSSEQEVLRSTDNGETWTPVGTMKGTAAVGGNGRSLYAVSFAGGSFWQSPEADGVTWVEQRAGAQKFIRGAYEMQFDATNDILYASLQGAGIWALKSP